jgi:cytochrome c oxidase subunit II
VAQAGAAGFAALAVTLHSAQAAGSAPLNYFLHSAGAATHRSMVLGWIFTGVATLVSLIVAALLAYAIWRRRGASELNDSVTHRPGGMRWVLIGTAISTGILLVLAVYSMWVLNDSANPPEKPGLVITVTGYDWWWQAAYQDGDPSERFVTANEIHIPVGVPVEINLQSADVIHAFWVPQLAGKTQMIPGLSNHQWLEADHPGIYRGQCTQYCGVQHAHMAFLVIADDASTFAAWRRHQATIQAVSEDPKVRAGQVIFDEQCAGCHTVRGTSAAGVHAPDLTHFASRREIGAGVLANGPRSSLIWISHVQELKPGARMPDFEFAAPQAEMLSAFLSSLQ